MIYVRVRGVDVFLLHSLRTGIEQSSAEGSDISVDTNPREHYPSGIFVEELSVVAFKAKTGRDEKFLVVSFCKSRFCKVVA